MIPVYIFVVFSKPFIPQIVGHHFQYASHAGSPELNLSKEIDHCVLIYETHVSRDIIMLST